MDSVALNAIKPQIRSYLELERLFGMSEIDSFEVKNGRNQGFSLLVLLPDKLTKEDEKQLLERMLGTLELRPEQYIIANLRHGGAATTLIGKYRPKSILAIGEVNEIFGMNDLKCNFSCKYGKIYVVGCYSPCHLLTNPGDKWQSWQSLLLLKSQLEP